MNFRFWESLEFKEAVNGDDRKGDEEVCVKVVSEGRKEGSWSSASHTEKRLRFERVGGASEGERFCAKAGMEILAKAPKNKPAKPRLA